MNKTFEIILITLLSLIIASARVIQYNHILEFSKYEIDEKSSTEEDNLSVNIYSIDSMETKFKAMVEELGKQQQQLFENNQKLSENLTQRLNNDYQNFNEDIMNIITGINKSLIDFEKVKIESEKKKSQLRDEIISEMMIYDAEIRDHYLNYKVKIEPLTNEKKMLTSLIEKCTQCDTKRIENLKRESEAVQRSLDMERDNYEAETRPIQDKLDKLKKNFTTNFANILIDENKFYTAFMGELKQTQKLQNFMLDLNKVFEKYSKDKSQIDSNFQVEISNLNKNLKFDNIKPTEHELIYKTNNYEMNNQNFPENLIRITQENQYSGNLIMAQEPIVNDPSYLQWEKIHEKTRFVPDNAVIAGRDVDGSTIYVVRAENNGIYTYGKYAHSENRRNAYIPYEDAEKGVEEIEILTTITYKWCKYDKNKYYGNLPVCRASYNGSGVPGTLQPDGYCRIGYGWKVHRINKNIEVLRIYEC